MAVAPHRTGGMAGGRLSTGDNILTASADHFTGITNSLAGITYILAASANAHGEV